MQLLVLVESYIAWHYGRAYIDMYRIWMNLFWFIFHFFSISTLLSTFFQPWKRMDEQYPKGFDPAGWAGVIIINTLMRLVGMTVKAVLILFGLFLSLTLLLVGLVVFAVWTAMPIFLVSIIALGIYLTIHG